jgi:hypothetical protein
MANPHPKLENLTPFPKGHPRYGGRKKGTPDKITGNYIMDVFNEILANDLTFVDAAGNKETKQGVKWVTLGFIKRLAKKGDAKSMELLLKLYGLLKDKVELDGNVKFDRGDITTERVAGELKILTDAIRGRISGNNK